MNKLFIFITLLISILFTFGNFAFAQSPRTEAPRNEYTLLEPLPCIDGSGMNCEGGAVRKITADYYIGYIYRFAIAIGAAAAVFMIAFAGFQLLTSDIVDKRSDAKNRIWNAIGGLLMLLSSYLILETIDPNLVKIDTTLEPIGIREAFVGPDIAGFDAINQLRNTEIQEKISAARTMQDEAEQLKKEAEQMRSQRISEEIIEKKLFEAREKENLSRYEIARVQIQGLSNVAISEIKKITDSQYFNHGLSKNEKILAKQHMDRLELMSDIYIEEIKTRDPNLAQKIIDYRNYQIMTTKERVLNNYILANPSPGLVKIVLNMYTNNKTPSEPFDLALIRSGRSNVDILTISDPEIRKKYEQERKERVLELNHIYKLLVF